MNPNRKAGNIQNNKGFTGLGNGINMAYGNNQLQMQGQNPKFGGKSTINTIGGGKNLSQKPQNFSQDDVNEAKEALKSLKKKMVDVGNVKQGTGGRIQDSRKPFMPTFNVEEPSSGIGGGRGSNGLSNKISIKSTKIGSGSAFSNGKGGFMGNMQANPDDDRVAVASGSPKMDVSPYPEDDNANGTLLECPDCGRKFNEEVYEKHTKNCKKVFKQKRKAFDTKKQRVLDSEHAAILRQKEIEEKKKGKVGSQISNSKAVSGLNKKGKWKKQSEEFRAIIKANKTSDGFGNQGMKAIPGKKVGGTAYGSKMVPQYTSSAVTDDYIACQYCNRKYNEQAYSKHFAGCERRAKESMMKNKIKAGTSGNSNMSNKPNLNVRFGKK